MSKEGNAISFAGNLTDDPELRHTESGIARPMFRVAVSGRRGQEPSFFTVIVWRDQAEHAVQSLSKGSPSGGSWAGSSSGAGPPKTAAPAPPSAPEFGELLGKRSALVVTSSSSGRTQR